MNRRLILEELNIRKALQAKIPNVLEHAFPQQIAFINDPSKQKALFCTRRAAKSFTIGLYLVKIALEKPGANCLFVGLTRDSAKAIIWKDILTVINTRYNLNASFNQVSLTMTIPNGSVIYVTGADTSEDEMNKLLGRKWDLAGIDEASMYSINLRNMVYGVLGPAMADSLGTTCLMGTASNFPRGLFYDVTTRIERGWKLYEWTAFDNPYVAKQWQTILDQISLNRPEYMQTPQYKQWYLNQWVIDEEKLVYRFDMHKNLVKQIPLNLSSNNWSVVLGVDTGWEDDSALVLTAYHLHDPCLYVLRVFKQKKMTFDEVSAKIQELMRDPQWAPHKIIIDGANKQGVESMRFRSNIPFEYADKKDKATFIELCNSDLIQAKIKILDTTENRPLWEEMSALVWVTDGDKIKFPKKEHPSLANHLCDAFLYSWRCGYHYVSTAPEKKIVIGSAEWYRKQSEDMWDKEREHLEASSNSNDWPEMGSLGDLG